MTDGNIKHDRRRVLAGIGGVVTVGVLAGCGGNGNGDSGGNGDTGGNGNSGGNGDTAGNGNSGGNGDTGGNGNSGGNGDTAGSGNGSGDGGAGDGSGSAAWEPFSFTETGTFVFEVQERDGMSGTMTWEIQSVSDGQATVRAAVDTDRVDSEVTITGSPEQIRQQLLTSPAGTILSTTFFAAPIVQAQGKEFEVGDGWSIQTGEGSTSMRVTGTESRAGVSCKAWEYTVDGQTMMEGCVSTRYQMVVYMEVYEESSGDSEFRIELTDFTPG